MPPVTQTKAAHASALFTVHASRLHVLTPLLALAGLLTIFLTLQSLLPLATAIKIGADEDFELSKAVLLNPASKG